VHQPKQTAVKECTCMHKREKRGCVVGGEGKKRK
jgi:hypothetical protein